MVQIWERTQSPYIIHNNKTNSESITIALCLFVPYKYGKPVDVLEIDVESS